MKAIIVHGNYYTRSSLWTAKAMLSYRARLAFRITFNLGWPSTSWDRESQILPCLAFPPLHTFDLVSVTKLCGRQRNAGR